MRRMFHAKYTRIGNNSPALIKAVKIDLTRHVASTLDALQDETRYALDRELGTWKVAEGDEEDEFDDQQGSFVSWVMKWTDVKNRENPSTLAENQVTLSFAAIYTTTMASTHAIFDLISHPEFIAPLREEIDQVTAEDGYEIDGSGKKNLKKQSFAKLKKLDSFLKESQRFSPSGLISNLRLTTAPLLLSTGHTIPAGVRIGYNLYQVNNTDPRVSPISNLSSTAPSLDSPSSFSPFRWSSLRSVPGNESKYQFVTTSKEAMNFGHGSHACPGRFFASAEIKVVLVELLTNWDIRLVGDEMGTGGERPANFVLDATIGANPRAEVELRRRKV
ncbi:hypothetical protein EYC84_011978 [Monilinia fructicola]|uniref:Cytochrome P450 n=1 Tax=Monilinia fructicola TaxID=38448 RepID=A0A5M9J5N1_MONFR|nr:hypothetical protein EYC84_011978 [Monilinia fructicola]